MDYEAYRQSFFVEPPPEPGYAFTGQLGAALYFHEYERAVAYYQQVLGPPGYVEGDSTRGWRLGNTWLTLLRARQGSPSNVDLQIIMTSAEEAEKLQQGFIDAGGKGPAPSDQLMYDRIRSCPVEDPFGTMLMIFSLI